LTIVFNLGDEFWIEQLNLVVQLQDAAGEYSSAVLNLQKPGNAVGYTITPTNPADNDNVQAVGIVHLTNQAGGSIASGAFITGVTANITKAIGTAGNTNVSINVSLLMRGTGPISV